MLEFDQFRQFYRLTTSTFELSAERSAARRLDLA